MASSTDPRAAGFNAAAVRDAVEFAMTMGAPESPQERVQFVFVAQKSYEKADASGNPYQWTAPVTRSVGEDRTVEVPVAMEFISRVSQARDTSVGYLLPSHVELYIMDTHIDQVREADHVLIDENKYQILSWMPPIGLFDFTLYPVLCEAVDES